MNDLEDRTEYAQEKYLLVSEFLAPVGRLDFRDNRLASHVSYPLTMIQ
jgi:hypothetical protein